MFRSYLKSALRNIRKHKILSLVNVAGLAVGLAGCVLIGLYVSDELSYDDFHENDASTFRLMSAFIDKDGSVRERGPYVPLAAGPLLESYFPEIERTIRLDGQTGTVRSERTLDNERITFADAPFFEVFSFPLLRGDASTVLSDDHSAVLSRRLALKYFGDKDPVGRTLTVSFGDNAMDFIVSGVAADAPRNSTITFDMLVPVRNLPGAAYPDILTALGDFSYRVFIKLRPDADRVSVGTRLDAFTTQAFAAEFKKWREDGAAKTAGNPIRFDLQRLRDMHLDQDADDAANVSHIFLLAGIALIVLVVAGINFVNLSIGRAAARATEVGVRKVIGAFKRQLAFQFWTESLVLIGGALVLGLVLAVFMMPVFNHLSGKTLVFSDLGKPLNILIIAGLLLAAAAASGSYPALVMAGIDPSRVLKGKGGFGNRKTRGRHRGPAGALVVIQFALSAFLITTTAVLGRQIRFMAGRNTGYDKEGLVRVTLQTRTDEEARALIGRFKDWASSFPGIVRVSGVNNAFGVGSSRTTIERNGTEIPVYQYRVDADYVQTLGLTIVEGRDFAPGSADKDATIVNQEFLRRMGAQGAVGHLIGEFAPGKAGDYPFRLRIIGVVKDYHYLSFKQRLQPMILHNQEGWGLDNLLVRVRASGVSGTLKAMEKAWAGIRPGKPFLYAFVEDDLESQYKTETRWNGIIRYSSIFAGVIAGLGVFGLALLAVRRRFKEIGIRKVLGAGIPGVFGLITGRFLLLVGAANALAWPPAALVLRRVLENYPYRITPGFPDFLIAGLLTAATALATTGWLSLKAAISNPVEAIRHE